MKRSVPGDMLAAAKALGVDAECFARGRHEAGAVIAGVSGPVPTIEAEAWLYGFAFAVGSFMQAMSRAYASDPALVDKSKWSMAVALGASSYEGFVREEAE